MLTYVSLRLVSEGYVGLAYVWLAKVMLVYVSLRLVTLGYINPFMPNGHFSAHLQLKNLGGAQIILQ